MKKKKKYNMPNRYIILMFTDKITSKLLVHYTHHNITDYHQPTTCSPNYKDSSTQLVSYSLSVSHMIYRVFMRAANFVKVNGRKAHDMSKVSDFYLEKVVLLHNTH